jgi:hypothetical protein
MSRIPVTTLTFLLLLSLIQYSFQTEHEEHHHVHRPITETYKAIDIVSLKSSINKCCFSQQSPATVIIASNITIISEGPLIIPCSNTILQIDGTLKFTDNPDAFPLVDPLPSYGTGRDLATDKTYHPLIYAENVSNISIIGSGEIDGNGGRWWKEHFRGGLNYSRPPLIEVQYVKNFRVEGVGIRDSPFWTVHPYASEDVIIKGVEVREKKTK